MRVLIAGAAALMFAATPCAAESPAADPRTPEAIALQTALDRICLPLVGGRDVEEVAKATGLRDKDGQWVLPLTGDKRISVLPPSRANPTSAR